MRVPPFPPPAVLSSEILSSESLPCQVLPPGVPVLAMEALAAEGWCKYAHSVIGMRSFGCSAPAKGEGAGINSQ